MRALLSLILFKPETQTFPKLEKKLFDICTDLSQKGILRSPVIEFKIELGNRTCSLRVSWKNLPPHKLSKEVLQDRISYYEGFDVKDLLTYNSTPKGAILFRCREGFISFLDSVLESTSKSKMDLRECVIL